MTTFDMFSTLLGKVKRIAGPILANEITGVIAARIFDDKIPHRGLVIDTSDSVVTPHIKAALLLRGYESGEYRFVQKYLPIDADVLELGGSLGVISCAIRRRLKLDRKLVIVEADPRLARSLQRNLLLNDCARNVHIEQVAVAYGAGDTVAFDLGETSVSGCLSTHGSSQASVEVRAVTLSELIDAHELRDFCLVSDIEGVEGRMIAEDMEGLAQARLIIMETHDNPEFRTYENTISQLKMSGLFRLIDRHGPIVVLERTEAVQGRR